MRETDNIPILKISSPSTQFTSSVGRINHFSKKLDLLKGNIYMKHMLLKSHEIKLAIIPYVKLCVTRDIHIPFLQNTASKCDGPNDPEHCARHQF